MVATKFLPRKRSSGVAQRYLAAIDPEHQHQHQPVPPSPGARSTSKSPHNTSKTVGESSRDDLSPFSSTRQPQQQQQQLDVSQDLSATSRTPDSAAERQNDSGFFPRTHLRATRSTPESSNPAVQQQQQQVLEPQRQSFPSTTRNKRRGGGGGGSYAHQPYHSTDESSTPSLPAVNDDGRRSSRPEARRLHFPSDHPLHEHLDTTDSSMESSIRTSSSQEVTPLPQYHQPGSQPPSPFTFEKGLNMILSNTWANCNAGAANNVDGSFWGQQERANHPHQVVAERESVRLSSSARRLSPSAATAATPMIQRSIPITEQTEMRSDVTGASTRVVSNRATDLALQRIRAQKAARERRERIRAQPDDPEASRKVAHSLLSLSSAEEEAKAAAEAKAAEATTAAAMNRGSKLRQHVEQQSKLRSSRLNDSFFHHYDGSTTSQSQSQSNQSKSMSSSVGVEINGRGTEKVKTTLRAVIGSGGGRRQAASQQPSVASVPEEDETGSAFTPHQGGSSLEDSTGGLLLPKLAAAKVHPPARQQPQLGPTLKRTFRVGATSNSGQIAKLVQQRLRQSSVETDSCLSPPKITRRTLSHEEPSPDPVFCSKSLSAYSPSVPSQESYDEEGSFESEDAMFMEKQAMGEESSPSVFTPQSDAGTIPGPEQRKNAMNETGLTIPDFDKGSSIFGSNVGQSVFSNKDRMINTGNTGFGSEFSNRESPGFGSEFEDKGNNGATQRALSPYLEILGPPSHPVVSVDRTRIAEAAVLRTPHRRMESRGDKQMESARTGPAAYPALPWRRESVGDKQIERRRFPTQRLVPVLPLKRSPGFSPPRRPPVLSPPTIPRATELPANDQAQNGLRPENTSPAARQEGVANSFVTERAKELTRNLVSPTFLKRTSDERAILGWRGRKEGTGSLAAKLQRSPDNSMSEMDEVSVDVKSIRSAFESVMSDQVTDDDDSASVKSLREKFEIPEPAAENGISRVVAMFEAKKPAPARAFHTTNTNLKDAFSKFEANSGNSRFRKQQGVGRLVPIVRGPLHASDERGEKGRNDAGDGMQQSAASPPRNTPLLVANRIRSVRAHRHGFGNIDADSGGQAKHVEKRPDPPASPTNSCDKEPAHSKKDEPAIQKPIQAPVAVAAKPARPPPRDAPGKDTRPSWMLHRDKILSRSGRQTQTPKKAQAMEEKSDTEITQNPSNLPSFPKVGRVENAAPSDKDMAPISARAMPVATQAVTVDSLRRSPPLVDDFRNEVPVSKQSEDTPIVRVDEALHARASNNQANNHISMQCFDGQSPPEISQNESSFAADFLQGRKDQEKIELPANSNPSRNGSESEAEAIGPKHAGSSSVQNSIRSFMSDPTIRTDVDVTKNDRRTRESPIVIKPVPRKPFVKPVPIKPVMKPVSVKEFAQPATGSQTGYGTSGDPRMPAQTAGFNDDENEKILSRLVAGITKPLDVNLATENVSDDESGTESGFSDGVTLDVSIAEVSNLTNPTALVGRAATFSPDGQQHSDDGDRSTEVEAKRSEASSSQPSEAAAPLIAKAMRKIPMSDEISTDSYFRSQRSIAKRKDYKSSGWDARNILDLNIVTPRSASTASDTISDEKKEDDYGTSDASWDLQQMLSLFPLESRSAGKTGSFGANSAEKNSSFETNKLWNPFPTSSEPATDGRSSNTFFEDVEEHLNRAARSKTPTRTNRSRRPRVEVPSVAPKEPDNAPATAHTQRVSPAINVAESGSGSSHLPPRRPESDVGSSYRFPRLSSFKPPTALSSSGSSDHYAASATSAATTGVMNNARSKTNPYGPKHAALLARIRQLKEARLRRAAAIYGRTPSTSGFSPMNSFDEQSQSTGNSSTRFGGESFLASLEVD